jgi:hypothetical protein
MTRPLRREPRAARCKKKSAAARFSSAIPGSFEQKNKKFPDYFLS